MNTAEHAFSLGLELLPPWVQKTFFFGGYGDGRLRCLEGSHHRRRDTLGRDSAPDENPSTPIFYELAEMLGR